MEGLMELVLGWLMRCRRNYACQCVLAEKYNVCSNYINCALFPFLDRDIQRMSESAQFGGYGLGFSIMAQS